MPASLPVYTDAQILAARPAKNQVDPRAAYAWLVEPERSAAGRVEDVATLFLTNRECPFRCLMCDLWRNTTDARVPSGAIVEQIDKALAQLPTASHIKLYNSGNFFDPQAIPPEDFRSIANRLADFETVIVENHPRMCGDACLRFRDLLPGQLEIALGLETIHPHVLPRLNKRMSLQDFANAARFLVTAGIRVRAFVLLRPPFLTEAEGVEWASKSVEFAFEHGVDCCAIIPTRAGNGMLETLAERGEFAPPGIHALEAVLEQGIALQRGRVFVDLWDAERFCACPACGPLRLERLRQMNLGQRLAPVIDCPRNCAP